MARKSTRGQPTAVTRAIGVGLENTFAVALTPITLVNRATVQLTSEFRQLGTWMGNLASPIRDLGNNIRAFASQPFDLLRGAIGKTVQAIEGMGSSFAGLVAKANPGAFNQFRIAQEDSLAVLGQALTPVLQAVTGIIRHLGDTLQTLRPVIDPIMESVARMVKIFGGLIEPAAKILTPLLDLFGQAMQALEPIFESMVQGVRWAADRMVEAIKWMVESYNSFSSWLKSKSSDLKNGLDVIGEDLAIWSKKHLTIGQVDEAAVARMEKLRDDIVNGRTGWKGIDIGQLQLRQLEELQKRSSVGAAVRPASFVGLEDVGKSIRAAAFSSGINSAAERTANHTAEMSATLKRIESNFAPNGSGRLRPVPQVSEIDFARSSSGHLRPVPRVGDH